jgi:hypothetical protein
MFYYNDIWFILLCFNTRLLWISKLILFWQVVENAYVFPLLGISAGQLNTMSKLIYVCYLKKTLCLRRMTYAQAVVLHITCMTWFAWITVSNFVYAESLENQPSVFCKNGNYKCYFISKYTSNCHILAALWQEPEQRVLFLILNYLNELIFSVTLSVTVYSCIILSTQGSRNYKYSIWK